MEIDIQRLYHEVPLAWHVNYPWTVVDRLRFNINEIESYRQTLGKRREDVVVYDVACGIGKNAFPLAHLGYRVLGLDNGPETIAYLDEHNTYDNFRPLLFDIDTADYYTLPQKPDVILVASILEHLSDPLCVMEKLLACAPQCLVLGEIPNARGASELAHGMRKWVSCRWGESACYRAMADFFRVKNSEDSSNSVSLTDTPHITDFTPGVLRRLCGELGLADTGVVNANFIVGTPVLHKLLLLKYAPLQRLDIRMAKYLPRWLGNGWYFRAVKCS
jgi:SAM-dependent methyltransferase